MTKEKEKGQEQVGSRTFLINSIQLQDLMRYLMTRPYAEVVTLNQLDPSIGADFVKKQTGETNGKK